MKEFLEGACYRIRHRISSACQSLSPGFRNLHAARRSRAVPPSFFAALVALTLAAALSVQSLPGLVRPATAQSVATGTPAAMDLERPCDVEPRPVEDLLELEDATPGFLRQFAEAVGTPFTRPIPNLDGIPADPRVVAGVTETIEKVYACGNAGQMLSVAALSTDDYLSRALGGLPADTFLAMATPQPVRDEHQSTLLSVEDVRLLPDGRVVATTRSSESTTVNIFVESNGRYLIDDNFDVALVGTPTPSPAFGPIDPVECTVEPRPIEDVLRLAEEIPDPAINLMLGTPVADETLPTGGIPASQEVVDAVTETARQIVACWNAFDIPRSGALATDAYFYRQFSGPGADFDVEAHPEFLGPHPFPPRLWRSLRAVDDVRMLPDGRVRAVVETSQGAIVAVFVESGGRYLIDEGYPLPDSETNAARRLFQILVSRVLGEGPFYNLESGGATPVAGARFPKVECSVDPRSMAELKDLADEPLALPLGIFLSTPSPDVEPPSGGTLRDAKLVAAVTAAVQEQIACMNDGDLPRLTALMSDDFLRRSLGGVSELAFGALYTTFPMPETDRSTLIAMDDVRVLSDGRISAIVTTETGRSQRIFVQVGGRYLVNDNFPIYE